MRHCQMLRFDVADTPDVDHRYSDGSDLQLLPYVVQPLPDQPRSVSAGRQAGWGGPAMLC